MFNSRYFSWTGIRRTGREYRQHGRSSQRTLILHRRHEDLPVFVREFHESRIDIGDDFGYGQANNANCEDCHHWTRPIDVTMLVDLDQGKSSPRELSKRSRIKKIETETCNFTFDVSLRTGLSLELRRLLMDKRP